MPEQIVLIAPAGIGAVRTGDDLVRMVLDATRAEGIELHDGDFVVFAQKIVSKAEGRYVELAGIQPSERARELADRCRKDPRLVELILRESRTVLRAVPDVLIVEDRRGLVLANAGIDRSNVDQAGDGGERVLLLPEDPDASASRLRREFAARADVDVGVIINDSLGRAWRLGTVGVAIGVSGMPSLLDRRGDPDRQGRPLESTEIGFADELAAAASALMGQAAEGRPVVVIRGAPRRSAEGNAAQLLRPRDKDLFR